jgi:hypothetical protein
MSDNSLFRITQDGIESFTIQISAQRILERLQSRMQTSYGILESIESKISEAIAERWVRENYHKVAEKIDPQHIANLSILKSQERSQ